MSKFITALIARRDRLCQEHADLLKQGRTMEAADLLPEVRFACRQANDALQGK